MKIHRFIGDFKLQNSTLDLSNSAIFHQVSKVLKLKTGELVILCNNQSQEAVAKIINLTKNNFLVQIQDLKTLPPPNKQITLYCAVLKRENFELVVQKSTEIGVSKIIPILTLRTIKQKLNLERLQKIAHEAAEQSGRGFIPSISEVVDLKEALRLSKDQNQNIVFELNSPAYKPLAKSKSKLGIFIGPEGGWDTQEIKLMQQNQVTPLSLGETTLRAETAAIVATYLTVNT